MALGIWTDGLPCNWDRTASLVTVTMSFPGLEGKWANLRLIQNYILMCFFVFSKGVVHADCCMILNCMCLMHVFFVFFHFVFAHLRLPLVAIPECYVGPHTYEDLMEIVAWSLGILAVGMKPTERHDEGEWLPSDRGNVRGRHADPKCRANQRGPLALSAAIVQVCIDWKACKEVFQFPQHNEKKGCCYKCHCTPDEVRCCATKLLFPASSKGSGS